MKKSFLLFFASNNLKSPTGRNKMRSDGHPEARLDYKDMRLGLGLKEIQIGRFISKYIKNKNYRYSAE